MGVEETEMVSTGEVARALGVRINTVKNWAKAGRILARRLPSGHLRIPRSEIERLLRSSYEGPPPVPRRQAWAEYERWRSTQPVDRPSLDRVLAWAESTRRLALADGKAVEATPEEKAARVRRLHRALGTLSN